MDVLFRYIRNSLCFFSHHKPSYHLILIAYAVFLIGDDCVAQEGGPTHAETVFSTSQGLGFDKQISIWLVEKYISPDRPIAFFDGNSPPPNTQLFDEPGADFFRSATRSTYEQLADAYRIDHPATNYLKRITFDIEINLWLPDELTDSRSAEKAFRSLQEQWGRSHVPHACYKEYFDSLESLYYKSKSLQGAENIVQNLTCQTEALGAHINDPMKLVSELPIPILLGHIRSGATVAFIDVREPDEFAENHIPGAENILIRDVTADTARKLGAYDIIVAYCIKDFRGFEMAKKLKSLGVSQAVILSPYGIKGWIDSKLPVFQRGSVSEHEATIQLNTCIDQPTECLINQTPKPQTELQ